MSARELPYPLFDGGAIQYVQVKGRTKIAIRGQISEYIPNPTFSVVARPGAMEEYFKVGNPDGKSRREIFGEPMKSIPAFREPAPRLELMDELGIQRSLMFPTLEDLKELSGIVGVERVLFGSDYPHPEGLADPVTYVDVLGKLTRAEQAKIMGGNLASLIDAA